MAEIQAASPEAAQWPPADYLKYELRVAVTGARVAGFLSARRLAEGESEILNLAVSPEYRRKGAARALVAAWISQFPGTLYLEVRASNTEAQNCYKQLGFQEVGRREDYYETPREGAIVLKFHSC